MFRQFQLSQHHLFSSVSQLLPSHDHIYTVRIVLCQAPLGSRQQLLEFRELI
jgi:hypothetical protein